MTLDTFELTLLSALLKDEILLKKTIGLIEPIMFTSSLCLELHDFLKIYYREYSKIPSKTELLHLYSNSKPIEDSKPFESLLDLLLSQSVSSDFVMSELNKFIRLRSLEKLFRSNYDSVKIGKDVDTSVIVSEIFKIQLSTLKDKKVYGVSINEIDYLLEQNKLRKFIPTNVPFLNEILEGGGICSGQLGVILAPPNYGKTMMLLNFALYAYLKKFNVLFVTLEMQDYAIMKRIMFLLSGALQENVNYNSMRRITSQLENKFMILYKPVKTLTVDCLYSIYHQAVADDIKFDVIFIDYADLLTTVSKYKEKRFELADIFVALKGFAQVTETPVWTATQTNREGMRAETVTMEHLAEDFSKGMTSDIILSLSNKMEADRVLKLYLTKQREGRSNITINTFVSRNMWCEHRDNLETVSLNEGI